MEKKYIMIIENNAVISTELPTPLECPRCNKQYWVIWGNGDAVPISNECKCKDQAPNVDKCAKELEKKTKTTTEPTEPPAEPTEPPAEPKPSVW